MGSVFKRDRDPLKGSADEAQRGGISMMSVAPDSYAECYPGYFHSLASTI